MIQKNLIRICPALTQLYLKPLCLLLRVDPLPHVVLELGDERVVRLPRPGGLDLGLALLGRDSIAIPSFRIILRIILRIGIELNLF